MVVDLKGNYPRGSNSEEKALKTDGWMITCLLGTFWDGLFARAILNFQGVPERYPTCFLLLPSTVVCDLTLIKDEKSTQ